MTADRTSPAAPASRTDQALGARRPAADAARRRRAGPGGDGGRPFAQPPRGVPGRRGAEPPDLPGRGVVAGPAAPWSWPWPSRWAPTTPTTTPTASGAPTMCGSARCGWWRRAWPRPARSSAPRCAASGSPAWSGSALAWATSLVDPPGRGGLPGRRAGSTPVVPGPTATPGSASCSCSCSSGWWPPSAPSTSRPCGSTSRWCGWRRRWWGCWPPPCCWPTTCGTSRPTRRPASGRWPSGSGAGTPDGPTWPASCCPSAPCWSGP